MKPRAMDLANGVPLPPSMVGVMVLLDRSGSMKGIKKPMEAAFADFVQTQKDISPDGMWLTLHQFDDRAYEVVHDKTPLSQLGALALAPRGGTPLRDSLYRFGNEARQIIEDPNENTERLLLLIVTDGQDNSGLQTHSWSEVRELIQGLKGPDCETMWFGTSEALMEAQDEMPTFKDPGASVAYAANEQGVNYLGETMKVATAAMRSGVSGQSVNHAYMSHTSAAQAYSAPKLDAKGLTELVNKARSGETISAGGVPTEKA